MTVRASLLLAGLLATLPPAAALAADVPGNKNSRVVLETGATGVRGVFEIKGDADWFRVRLVDGRNYAITGAPGGPDFDNCVIVRLRNPQGKVLRSTQNSGFSDAGFEFRSGRTGNFFVELKDCSSSGHPLSYVGRATADARGDRTTDAGIAVGQTVNGRANWGVDHDWYRTRLARGTSYTATLGAGVEFEIRVVDASGAVLFREDASGGGAISGFTVPATGTYFVVVAGTSDFGGGYTLGLTQP
jgi:hypothetical protein